MPYRSARQPTAATLAPDSAAASSSSIDSCLAAWMKPQVFTKTTLASSSSVSSQPEAVRRAASSSESTSLRAQPRVTRLTVRGADAGRRDTPRAYPAAWVFVPGLKLRVTGTVLSGFWRWPLTVRMTPPGLPSRTSTACFSVHFIEAPAWITPM